MTDAVVTTEGTTTIGDFFEGGPTQTTDLIGLEGREAALARMGNKLKFGLEAAGATMLEPTLKAIGMGGRVAATAAARLSLHLSRVKHSRPALRFRLRAVNSRQIFLVQSVSRTSHQSSEGGNLPQDVAEVRSTIRGKVEAEATAAYTSCLSFVKIWIKPTRVSKRSWWDKHQ